MIRYKFPAISTSNLECAFMYNENTKGQNCRPVGIDFASSTHKSRVESNLETASKKIEAFKALDDWCLKAGFETSCNYPSPSQLAHSHASDPILRNNEDTALVIINNYQRKRGMGLLQRLYQPYFGMTIFCGTWEPREHIDDGLYPEMIHPFNYIHVSAAEIVRGVFLYYCLAKIRELRLRNIRGYFISADDAIFHFWQHMFDFDEIQYPVWVIKQRYPSAWWLTPYGYKAARRAERLFREMHQKNKKIKELWSCYQKGLLAQGHTEDAASHIRDDNGWTLSDFFYVPQKRLAYLAEAAEVFFKGDLFVELTMNKLLQTVPHNRIPQEKFAYVPKTLRYQWREYYRPDLIMIHPIKLNYFADFTNRTVFCETVVRSFKRALLQC
ncbi:hypothetical protein Y032_0176g542 [Ancylostoma ceylanicum]|nr:hypothetical protein Y032_0176g542 [Ancylostoma ceylanicum]